MTARAPRINEGGEERKENMEGIELGDKVLRVSADHTNGRVGFVIEINEAGRLRVAWEGHARTWVQPKCVVKVRSNE